MKKQSYFVFGILIGVLMMIACFSFTPAYGAEYENNDRVFKEEENNGKFEDQKDFSYYEIKIDCCTYRCESYELKDNMLTMNHVFMEGNEETYSEIIITSATEVEYIKKKKAISAKEVIKTNKSDCFIGTAMGE